MSDIGAREALLTTSTLISAKAVTVSLGADASARAEASTDSRAGCAASLGVSGAGSPDFGADSTCTGSTSEVARVRARSVHTTAIASASNATIPRMRLFMLLSPAFVQQRLRCRDPI